MGSNGQKTGPNGPIKIIGVDATYRIRPLDILYFALEPMAVASDQPPDTASKDRTPDAQGNNRRMSKAVVVCYFCRHLMAPRLIYTSVRSLSGYLYLTDCGFFRIHRSRIINLYHVQRCVHAAQKVIYFTYAVAHEMPVSKHIAASFLKAWEKV